MSTSIRLTFNEQILTFCESGEGFRPDTDLFVLYKDSNRLETMMKMHKLERVTTSEQLNKLVVAGVVKKRNHV